MKQKFNKALSLLLALAMCLTLLPMTVLAEEADVELSGVFLPFDDQLVDLKVYKTEKGKLVPAVVYSVEDDTMAKPWSENATWDYEYVTVQDDVSLAEAVTYLPTDVEHIDGACTTLLLHGDNNFTISGKSVYENIALAKDFTGTLTLDNVEIRLYAGEEELLSEPVIFGEEDMEGDKLEKALPLNLILKGKNVLASDCPIYATQRELTVSGEGSLELIGGEAALAAAKTTIESTVYVTMTDRRPEDIALARDYDFYAVRTNDLTVEAGALLDIATMNAYAIAPLKTSKKDVQLAGAQAETPGSLTVNGAVTVQCIESYYMDVELADYAQGLIYMNEVTVGATGNLSIDTADAYSIALRVEPVYTGDEYEKGTLTVNGGTLTVNAYCGRPAVQAYSMTVESGTVTVHNGYVTPVYYAGLCGPAIYANELNVKGGTLNALSGDGGIYDVELAGVDTVGAITIEKEMNVTGGVVKATGLSASAIALQGDCDFSSDVALAAEDNAVFTLTGGKVYANGMMATLSGGEVALQGGELYAKHYGPESALVTNKLTVGAAKVWLEYVYDDEDASALFVTESYSTTEEPVAYYYDGDGLAQVPSDGLVKDTSKYYVYGFKFHPAENPGTTVTRPVPVLSYNDAQQPDSSDYYMVFEQPLPATQGKTCLNALDLDTEDLFDDDLDCYKLPAGDYYLSGDFEVEHPIELGNGETTIELNGYDLYLDNRTNDVALAVDAPLPCVIVGDKSELTITDRCAQDAYWGLNYGSWEKAPARFVSDRSGKLAAGDYDYFDDLGDCYPCGGRVIYSGNGNLVEVAKGGKFTLASGTLVSDAYEYTDGYNSIEDYADGQWKATNYDDCGSLVSVNGGTFTLDKNAALRFGATNGNGGNVCATNGATVTLNGTLVSGFARGNGGNVYAEGEGTTVTLSGATIRDGWTANRGGNVCLMDGAALTASSSELLGGSAFAWIRPQGESSSANCFGSGANLYVGAGTNATLTGCTLSASEFFGTESDGEGYRAAVNDGQPGVFAVFEDGEIRGSELQIEEGGSVTLNGGAVFSLIPNVLRSDVLNDVQTVVNNGTLTLKGDARIGDPLGMDGLLNCGTFITEKGSKPAVTLVSDGFFGSNVVNGQPVDPRFGTLELGSSAGVNLGLFVRGYELKNGKAAPVEDSELSITLNDIVMKTDADTAKVHFEVAGLLKSDLAHLTQMLQVLYDGAVLSANGTTNGYDAYNLANLFKLINAFFSAMDVDLDNNVEDLDALNAYLPMLLAYLKVLDGIGDLGLLKFDCAKNATTLQLLGDDGLTLKLDASKGKLTLDVKDFKGMLNSLPKTLDNLVTYFDKLNPDDYAFMLWGFGEMSEHSSASMVNAVRMIQAFVQEYAPMIKLTVIDVLCTDMLKQFDPNVKPLVPNATTGVIKIGTKTFDPGINDEKLFAAQLEKITFTNIVSATNVDIAALLYALLEQVEGPESMDLPILMVLRDVLPNALTRQVGTGEEDLAVFEYGYNYPAYLVADLLQTPGVYSIFPIGGVPEDVSLADSGYDMLDVLSTLMIGYTFGEDPISIGDFVILPTAKDRATVDRGSITKTSADVLVYEAADDTDVQLADYGYTKVLFPLPCEKLPIQVVLSGKTYPVLIDDGNDGFVKLADGTSYTPKVGSIYAEYVDAEGVIRLQNLTPDTKYTLGYSAKFNGKTYTSGNTTFTTLPVETFDASGIVYKKTGNDTKPESGAIVTFTSIATGNVYRMTEDKTDADGAFTVKELPAGDYTVEVRKNLEANNQVITDIITITNSNVTDLAFVLPKGNVSAQARVEDVADTNIAKTGKIKVGGLTQKAEQVVTEAGQTFVESDVYMIELIASDVADETTATDSVKIEAAFADAGKKIDITEYKTDFIDLKLMKTVNGGTPDDIGSEESNPVLTIAFEYDCAGKDIQISRVHNGVAQVFTSVSSKENPADMTFYVDEAHNIIYIFASKFSTYAISAKDTAVAKDSNPGFGGGGGGAASYTVKSETAANGSFTTDKKSAAAGNTVTVTVTPDKGFTLETLTVLDKDGNEIAVKNLGGNKFSFTMPDGDATVSATFMEDNTMLNFFVDVKASDYFYDAVLWAAENGITNGVDAVHFGPEIGVTRAQVVTFLWRAAGSPEPTGDASKFVDVPADEYYAKAVAWAIEKVITKGTSDTTFSPDVVCTRGQIVTFLARFAGVEDTDTESVFADVNATEFFAAAVKWAKDNGITSGVTETTFEPYTNCTRAQVVTFLYRHMVK